jgi:hypothetical protein
MTVQRGRYVFRKLEIKLHELWMSVALKVRVEIYTLVHFIVGEKCRGWRLFGSKEVESVPGRRKDFSYLTVKNKPSNP